MRGVAKVLEELNESYFQEKVTLQLGKDYLQTEVRLQKSGLYMMICPVSKNAK